ncbi:TetR/AcrR family transcriptional regulator [Aquibacillus saliphilus]|uniref:TetR/AcrR family transcriptional regulator n=1 Tax=Aquibacillus saliphilus TaxID=1909422 RepID=UPI001CF0C898|nr:TetR/AcrR family transcriptional regulator [Aquibacillus saliphilus]
MNEKKKKIIEESIKLFAKKGFHATSIQQIVDESNVSKGAFYLYFKSKEDLTVAIFEYYSSVIFERIGKIVANEKDPTQSLIRQTEVFLEMLSDHKEYIIMHFRDNLQLGDKLDHFILNMNKQSYEWTKMNLLQIYGDDVEPYIVDASIQLDGVLQSYCKSIVLHDLKINSGGLAAFIVKRLDDLVQGMLNSGDTPQFTVEQLSYHSLCKNESPTESDQVNDLIDQIKEKLNQLPLDVDTNKQLKEAAQLITSELAKQNPKMVIIQGMLTHFQAIPELKLECEQIANILTINLLLQD